MGCLSLKQMPQTCLNLHFFALHFSPAVLNLKHTMSPSGVCDAQKPLPEAAFMFLPLAPLLFPFGGDLPSELMVVVVAPSTLEGQASSSRGQEG